MARRMPKPDAGGGNSMGWLTTFNDLITLLMVFFVLMFSMGSVDTKKMQHFQDALSVGLGIVGAGDRTGVGLHPDALPEHPPGDTYDPEREDTGIPGPAPDAGGDLIGRLKALQRELGFMALEGPDGVLIRFEDLLLFDFGKAEISPGGLKLLDRLAAELRAADCLIRVEGHTDDVPIRTRRYPSNWDLSIARAVNVVKHLAYASGIEPRRLSAVGYGASRPLVPNDSAANRSKNRRVELVLEMEDQ